MVLEITNAVHQEEEINGRITDVHGLEHTEGANQHVFEGCCQPEQSGERHGLYTVKSAYRLLSEVEAQGRSHNLNRAVHSVANSDP
jgi:hypothetical protein